MKSCMPHPESSALICQYADQLSGTIFPCECTGWGRQNKEAEIMFFIGDLVEATAIYANPSSAAFLAYRDDSTGLTNS